MNTVHTLREYVDALRDAGILVESTVSDELAAREIHCLTYDTRALSEDALFICKGAHFKEEYLCDALSRGAIAYVAEKKHNVDVPCLLVNDIRYSLVVLGQLFYNHVTDKLTSVGITGTKGKSTTAYYVRYILNDWLRAQSMPECAFSPLSTTTTARAPRSPTSPRPRCLSSTSTLKTPMKAAFRIL